MDANDLLKVVDTIKAILSKYDHFDRNEILNIVLTYVAGERMKMKEDLQKQIDHINESMQRLPKPVVLINNPEKQ